MGGRIRQRDLAASGEFGGPQRSELIDRDGDGGGGADLVHANSAEIADLPVAERGDIGAGVGQSDVCPAVDDDLLGDRIGDGRTGDGRGEGQRIGLGGGEAEGVGAHIYAVQPGLGEAGEVGARKALNSRGEILNLHEIRGAEGDGAEGLGLQHGQIQGGRGAVIGVDDIDALGAEDCDVPDLHAMDIGGRVGQDGHVACGDLDRAKLVGLVHRQLDGVIICVDPVDASGAEKGDLVAGQLGRDIRAGINDLHEFRAGEGDA